MLGLHCCVQAFSSGGEWGLLSVAVHGLLIAVAALIAERWLSAHGLQELRLLVLVAPRSMWIFPDQGSNLCRLHWQWICNHWVTREVLSTISII